MAIESSADGTKSKRRSSWIRAGPESSDSVFEKKGSGDSHGEGGRSRRGEAEPARCGRLPRTREAAKSGEKGTERFLLRASRKNQLFQHLIVDF